MMKLKVIELASVLAGPSVGMFFAELGAEVLKVENKKTGGDVTRSWKLASENQKSTISAYYAAVNFGKNVVFWDLSNLSDREKLYTALKDADIIIANHRPSSAKKLGIDYESIKKINPNIIYGNITGFGEDSERVAFDVVLQAESGFMYMNGQPESPPTKMPVALVDVLAAHQLKEGLLYALWQREKDKKGAYVSVSLLEAAMSSLVNQATNWLMAGHIPQRMGSLHPNIAPYGEIFKTSDGKMIVLAIGNDRQFESLSNMLGLSSLVENEAYKDNVSRVKNRQSLELLLESAFLQYNSEYILEYALKNAIPLGQIRNMKEVFETKEANDLILNENIEGIETKRLKSIVFNITN
jgi:crotonobetainyl-CoA:carnitine CoA-transferase CaiB-like acyl-CoA transferase